MAAESDEQLVREADSPLWCANLNPSDFARIAWALETSQNVSAGEGTELNPYLAMMGVPSRVIADWELLSFAGLQGVYFVSEGKVEYLPPYSKVTDTYTMTAEEQEYRRSLVKLIADPRNPHASRLLCRIVEIDPGREQEITNVCKIAGLEPHKVNISGSVRAAPWWQTIERGGKYYQSKFAHED